MADIKYDIDVNTKDAVNSVEKLKRELNKTKESMKKTDKSSQGMSVGFSKAKAGVLAFAAAIAATAVASVKIASNFETLRTTLVSVTGGTKEAAIAFEFIQSIASQLPGSLEETTQAYTKLTALGIAPTKEAMISFANTAAATGKSMDQFVEAVADATTGEFERLKEFGIKVRQETDGLAVTFQGTTQKIGKDSASIQKFLQGIGENQFAGAATKQMDTLAGRFSNFKDTLSKLADELINNTGGMDLLKEALNGMTVAVQWLRDNLESITNFFSQDLPQAMQTWQDWLGLTGQKTAQFTSGAGSAIDDLKMVFKALFTDTRVLGVAFIDGLVSGFLSLQKFWNIFTEAMSFGWDTAINGISTAWLEFLNVFINGFNKVADNVPFMDSLKVDLFEINDTTESWADRMARVNGEFDSNLKLHKDSIDLWLQDIENSKTLDKAEKERAKNDLKKRLEEHNAALKVSQEALAKTAAATKASNEASDAHKALLKDLTKETLSLADANKTNLQRIDETRQMLLKHKDALIGNKLSAEEFQMAMDNLNDQSLRSSRDFKDGWRVAMDDYVDATSNGAQHAKDIFADTTASMEDSIKSFVTTGKFGFQELGKSIIDSLLNAQIAELTGKIMGGLRGSNGGAGSSIGDIFAGFFASGGLIPAGQFGIVGERGPELIGGPAQVTPLDNGKQVTYNINAVDANSFKQLVARDPAFMYAVTEQGRRSLPSGR